MEILLNYDERSSVFLKLVAHSIYHLKQTTLASPLKFCIFDGSDDLIDVLVRGVLDERNLTP
ncbi:hypothetical protein ACTXT7_011410 [Hymenolepis weldensis]